MNNNNNNHGTQFLSLTVLIIIMLIIAWIASSSLLHCVTIITNFQDGYIVVYTYSRLAHDFAAFVRSLDANELPMPFTSYDGTTKRITTIIIVTKVRATIHSKVYTIYYKIKTKISESQKKNDRERKREKNARIIK